jgi:hypothetical protein
MEPAVVFGQNGGKLTMDKGEAAMRAEFERLVPLMKRGEYGLRPPFQQHVEHQALPSNGGNTISFVRPVRRHRSGSHGGKG